MPKNDIGGFFVALGLNPDKHSFETGNKLIDGVTTSFNKLIGTARNVSVVLTGMATGSGVVESSTYKTANAIGTTTEKLDQWKAAAKIAGVSAGGLVGSMSQLASVMNHIKVNGAGLSEYAKKLGELHMGLNEIGDLDNMDRADAYAAIIRKAQEELKNNPEAQLRINTIVGDILGDAGQNLFIELTRQNKSIDEFLQEAKATIFTTAKDNEKGQNFLNEVNTLRASTESLTKLIGDNVGGELTPLVRDINKFIYENKDAIVNEIKDVSKLVGKIVDRLSKEAKPTGEVLAAGANVIEALTSDTPEEKERNIQEAQSIIDNLIENKDSGSIVGKVAGETASITSKITDKVFELLDKKKAEKELKEIYKANGSKKLRVGDTINLDDKIQFQKLLGEKKASKYIEDGIIRPNGQVPQVAPDDWVFAAKNVSDLARAFIPQNMSAAPATAQYSIVQNFTINGSNDIPQVLKQQAYNGVQDGLMQMMSRSSQRLQMMSGTR